MDNVNHPGHYNGKYECIEVMADVFGKQAVEDFCLANAFKYVWRAKKKGKYIEDLKKARYYLDYIINHQPSKEERSHEAD